MRRRSGVPRDRGVGTMDADQGQVGPRPQWRGAVRILVGAVAADAVGQGLLISTTTFYMLNVVGVSAATIGLGLTVAAIVGIVVSAPVGFLADRVDPVTLMVVATALQALPVLGYLVVDGMPSYLVVSTTYAVLFAAAIVAGAAMLPSVVPSEGRVSTRARTRVTSNIGISVGVALGGVALGVDEAWLYRLLFVVTAVGLIVSAAVFARLRPYRLAAAPDAVPDSDAAATDAPAPEVAAAPDTEPRDSEAPSPAVSVVSDRPYLVVTLIAAVIAINDGLLVVALPLWISRATSAPDWIYSVAVILNTVMVVLLQIPLSRWSDTARGAGRSVLWAGVSLAAACVLWGGAGEVSGVVAASVLLLAGALAHVVGELLSSAGGWGLSYDLAPESAHGRYQGVFGTGQQISNAFVPLVAGVFLVAHGWGGWLVVAAVLLVAGLLAPACVSWALRTPPRVPVTT